MKILVITPSFASFSFLQGMLEQMHAMGWEVHFASSNFSFGETHEAPIPIKFHSIPFPRGANIRGHLVAAKSLRRLVKQISPDIVDVHFSATMLTCALAVNKGWPPVLATIQGLRFPILSGIRKKIERKVECWSGKRMHTISVLTDDDYKALLDAGVNNAALQQACGFGCDIDHFDADLVTELEKEDAIRLSGLQPNETALIYVGRKTAFKGFHLVVNAFEIALQHNPNLRLIVCGNSDPIHPTGLTEAQEKAYSENPQISDMGWVDNVRGLLSLSYLNVFPSEREGMPVNLMESLAMGLPVITNDSRGCRDVVTHEKTGLVVKDLTASVLADRILLMVSNNTLRNTYASHALDDRNRFDRQHFINERINVFQHILQGKQKRGSAK